MFNLYDLSYRQMEWTYEHDLILVREILVVEPPQRETENGSYRTCESKYVHTGLKNTSLAAANGTGRTEHLGHTNVTLRSHLV